MTYVRNWPEGLFILLVMAVPMAAAVTRPGAGGFVVRLGAGMAVGLLAWVGIVWLACQRYGGGGQDA